MRFDVRVINVVYREISAVFLHPYTTYDLSEEVSVMNVIYREMSAVFLLSYKT
jgi:hypothetical protein